MASGTIQSPPIGVTEIGAKLSSGTDLNSITNFGIYYADSGSYTNSPESNSVFDLFVIPRAIASRSWQIMISYNPVGIYYRSMTGASSWSSWRKLTDVVI